MNTNRFQLLALAAALLAPASLHAQFSQPVRDVENPAQNATLRTGSLTMPGTVTGIGQSAEPPPLGKRFAIESLGVVCDGAKETEITKVFLTVRMRLSPGAAPVAAVFPIVMTRQGTDSSFELATWVGSLQGRVFHDNPDGLTIGPNIAVRRWPGTGSTTCTYAMTGGLTNLP
jgi:hypothetical protein